MFILAKSSYSPSILGVIDADHAPNLMETEEGEEEANEASTGLEEWTAKGAV